MSRTPTILGLAALGIFATSAAAGINMSNGATGSQSVFQQPGGGFGAPFQAQTSGQATYVTNGAPFAANNPDQMFYYNWFYQLPARSNRAFSFIDTPTESAANSNPFTVTYVNAGDVPAASGRIDATFSFVLTDGSQPGASRLDVTTVVKSNAANTATATYDFTNIIDLDLNGSATYDVHTAVTSAGDTVVTITDSTVSGKISQKAVLTAAGATLIQVGSGTTLRGFGGTTTNLNGTTSFTGDGTAGFQYQLTLAPGQSQTLLTSIEFFAVPEPTAFAALGGFAGAGLRRRRR